VLTIAAVLSGKSIFTSPVNLREEATKAHRRFHTDKFSDHLAFATAYDKWRSVVESQGVGAGADFSRTNFLSQTALNEVHQLREHFRGYLRDAGFVATTAADEDDVEGGEEMVVCASDDEDGEESTGIVDRKLEVQTEVDNSEVVRCALMAGLYPRILRVARYSDSGKKTSGRQDMLPIHILQPDKKEVQ
jgi:ATP-dependent RNA helicase DHX57